jgi:hypothetical protein
VSGRVSEVVVALGGCCVCQFLTAVPVSASCCSQVSSYYFEKMKLYGRYVSEGVAKIGGEVKWQVTLSYVQELG